MAYTVANLSLVPSREEAPKSSLVKLIQDTAATAILVGSNLRDLIAAKKDQEHRDEIAKIAVREVLEGASAKTADEEEAEDDTSPVFAMIKKIGIFVATTAFSLIVKPILTFAMRVAMNLVRFALRAVATVIIEPVIAAIVALAAANPVTAGVVAALAVGGAGYWIWKKFFKEETAKPGGLKEQPANLEPMTEAPSEFPMMPGVARVTQLAAPPPTAMGEVPMPEKSISDTIVAAAKSIGVDPGTLMAIAQAESNFNPTVINKGSTGKGTAEGLFQFTNKTWADMVALYGAQYGIGLGDRSNARANSIMGALLLRDDATQLKKAGITPNAGNLYMAHFMGYPKAIAFIKAVGKSPNADAAKMFPAEAAANVSIFYNADGSSRTLAEVYALMTTNPKKVTEAKAAAYNLALTQQASTNVAAADQPKFREGESIEMMKQKTLLPELAMNDKGLPTSPRGKLDKEYKVGPRKTLMEI